MVARGEVELSQLSRSENVNRTTMTLTATGGEKQERSVIMTTRKKKKEENSSVVSDGSLEPCTKFWHY